MLAYFDATGDKAVLEFLTDRFSNYVSPNAVSNAALTRQRREA
jgi:hypothetical protein